MSDTHFKFERFFDLSSDLLCVAGFDGYFKRINPAVSNLLGYTMEELYARPINDFIHEDDRQSTALVRQELTRAKPLLNFENRYRTKNGDIVWLSWTSHPVEEDRLIFAIAKNITHKKQLEEERNLLLAKLTEANKGLREMGYATSHDLRSPVNNLVSIIRLLDTSKIDDPDTTTLIELLKHSADSLNDTLNTYINNIKDKHNEDRSVEKLNFEKILSEVVDSISTLISSSNTTLLIDFSKQQTVLFNKTYLKSIFLNLLTNAIK